MLIFSTFSNHTIDVGVLSQVDSSAALNSASGLTPILMHGGVAVAVIFAMTYFNQIQLKSIAEIIAQIVKTLNIDSRG